MSTNGKKPDAATARGRLATLRDVLEVLGAAASASRATVELDQTRVGRLSRVDALQGQAMAQAAQRRREGELARIDAALARLDEGDYGLFVQCGEPIALKRLELDPAVATCIGCAARG